jgi:hypothetical protein
MPFMPAAIDHRKCGLKVATSLKPSQQAHLPAARRPAMSANGTWKSDVEINPDRLGAYRKETGAKRAILVLMTAGKVVNV